MPRLLPGHFAYAMESMEATRGGAVEGFGDGSETRGVDLFAGGEEAAETHDERVPLFGVDVVGLAFKAKRGSDVNAEDFDLEGD